MTYPNLTLLIRNNIPSLEWQKDENEKQPILLGSEGLDTMMMGAADLVGYDHQEDIEALMEFQHEGDWEFWHATEPDAARQDFQFKYLLNELSTVAQEYVIPAEATSPELKNQLRAYWQADMLASFLEEMYNVLIAQTFFTATELAIPTIVLNDHRQDTRLREKMSKELGAIPEVEFLVFE